MQRRKIVIATLSVLLFGLALPTATIPRAHAFIATSALTFTGLGVNGFTDPITGSLTDGIAAGSTLTVNVYLIASNVVYQRNVTVGYKGDWMTSYQNATNANPTSTLSMSASQVASVSIAVPMPSSGSVALHSWSVAVWDGAQNSLNAAGCSPFNNGERSPQCLLIPTTGFHSLAIYTGDQLSAAQASNQASIAIGLVPSTSSQPTAAGQLAQARTEASLGSQSWLTGDYGGSKTHFQNALNDANAAQASFTNLGGGSANAGIVSTIESGTGILLFGLGGLLAGIGGFFYLRRRPKA